MKYLVNPIALLLLVSANVCASQFCTEEGIQGCLNNALSTGKFGCDFWKEITNCMEDLKCPEVAINAGTETFESKTGLNCSSEQTCTQEIIEKCIDKLSDSQVIDCGSLNVVTNCWEDFKCPEQMIKAGTKAFESKSGLKCTTEHTCTEKKFDQCSDILLDSLKADCNLWKGITKCWEDLKCPEEAINAAAVVFESETGLNCTTEMTCTQENIEQCSDNLLVFPKKDCYFLRKCMEDLNCLTEVIDKKEKELEEASGLKCGSSSIFPSTSLLAVFLVGFWSKRTK